jgi:membrane protease YdiL (CAAX protease family)
MRFVKDHAVLLFCILTVGLTFATYTLPMPPESRALGFAALVVFIPSLVAIILAFLTEGVSGVKSLLAYLTAWRTGWKWYGLALLIGFGLRLGVAVLALITGSITRIDLTGFSPFLVSVFIFAAAEELGWRGFALSRLLKSQPPLIASLLLGVPWALLHLSLYLPGMMSEGLPAVPTLIVLIALSVMTCWMFINGGKGAVIASTILHGSQNFFVFLNGGISTSTAPWLMVVVYGLVAILIVVLNRPIWLKNPFALAPA